MISKIPTNCKKKANKKIGDCKAVVKNADMSDEVRPSSVDTVEDAMDRDNVEKDIPAHMKKAFDNMCNPTWHYIVDRNVGR